MSEKSCESCLTYRAGECMGRGLCEFYKPAPTKGKEYWPSVMRSRGTYTGSGDSGLFNIYDPNASGKNREIYDSSDTTPSMDVDNKKLDSQEVSMPTEEPVRKKEKTYADWVAAYPDLVVIRKEGFYYTVRGNSAYVIAVLTNYNIGEVGQTPMTGSPSLDVMTNELRSHHVSYIVVENNVIVDREEFVDNHFGKLISRQERIETVEHFDGIEQKDSSKDFSDEKHSAVFRVEGTKEQINNGYRMLRQAGLTVETLSKS